MFLTVSATGKLWAIIIDMISMNLLSKKNCLLVTG